MPLAETRCLGPSEDISEWRPRACPLAGNRQRQLLGLRDSAYGKVAVHFKGFGTSLHNLLGQKRGYGNAVGNLHGWSDGDPFLVNYVGHPMQGSVTGLIWQHNDRAYRDVVFGRNARYWKTKLRSAAFSCVFSVQFEIGPLSEASLGHIQASYPAQGFVDHVVTPAIVFLNRG